jgi:hypothetical protein
MSKDEVMLTHQIFALTFWTADIAAKWLPPLW